ncbi:hypothetical protein Phi13:2_gp028 [Cellulophaga phage phi13:2]|uniref:Uncharacterized protein n=1 Tax=Cellulophaga phage phi13:2 TaxID=1328030 RepID=S0A5P4_9CAUD|nr:hypothetical protein Phi13:2_gp028 [Cellulophaga phage phi13:2]AGO49638.1 hypothetical protein Phi13:2_gp028 [Cellulophaga phage phi13:2]
MKKEQNLNNAETQALNIPVVMSRFDIERKDLYEYDKPKERTRKRLTEMSECGMEETGIASFGYNGIMSGLYIEKVWGYSDEDFKDYMDWAKGLIAASLNGA